VQYALVNGTFLILYYMSQYESIGSYTPMVI